MEKIVEQRVFESFSGSDVLRVFCWTMWVQVRRRDAVQCDTVVHALLDHVGAGNAGAVAGGPCGCSYRRMSEHSVTERRAITC